MNCTSDVDGGFAGEPAFVRSESRGSFDRNDCGCEGAGLTAGVSRTSEPCAEPVIWVLRCGSVTY